MTQKQLTYMQENHEKYSKLCVYWIGPFIPWVFTSDVETMKMFLHQPGGTYITSYVAIYVYSSSMLSFMIYAFLLNFVHRQLTTCVDI